MEVKVLQEDLQKAVSLCSRFAASKVQLPILANIYLEVEKNKLRVVGTNLELSVSVSIGAKTEKEGVITVPSKIISDVVSNLKKGQVTIKSEKEMLEVVADMFSSKISGINAADFPKVPSDVGVGGVKISVESFLNAVEKVLFSVSADETRPVLTGVLFILRRGELVVVSTDGFRLSHFKITSPSLPDAETRFVIPKSAMSELSRISEAGDLEFLYKKQDNQIIFGTEHVVMSSRVIQGDFPDFEKIIPKDTKIKINVDKHELLRSIKLASVFARDSSNIVKIAVGKGSLEISSESSQYGSQKGRVDAKVDGLSGEGFVIGFNFRFLEEFLNVCKSDDVQIEFSDPNSPSLFLDTKDTAFFHIIMPVRLQN